MTRRFLLDRRRFLHAAGAAGAAMAASPRLPSAPNKTIVEMARAAERLADADIIDAHAHIHEPKARAIRPHDAELLLEDMDRCGIATALFSHVGALMAGDATELQRATDASARAVRAHAARLRGYVVFHPRYVEASRAQMKRLLEARSPFVGFKLHGPWHAYPADGAEYQPVFQFAHEHRLAVLFHVAGIGRDWNGGVAEIADQFRNMNLILAHLGPGEEALPQLMKGRHNLYVDTCLSTGRYRQIERIAQAIGPEKLLFATDAAYNSAAAGVGKIAFADLPEDDKKLILGGNARRIFGNRLPAK